MDQAASFQMVRPSRWANATARATSPAGVPDDESATSGPLQPEPAHPDGTDPNDVFRHQPLIGNGEAPGHENPEINPRPEASDEATSLRRELQRIHIFMISLSAVIGMGFYVRTGAIEATGGPSAVLLAYGFLGILSLAIMQCLATMLRIWPIRGALMAFVEAFVDEEMAIIVGWLYWLTYCFSFAGLTTTIGGLVDDLNVERSASIAVTICSLVLPILINLTDIRVFKRIEIFFGTIKLLLIFVIIVIMMSINSEVAHTHVNAPDKRGVVFISTGTAGWFGGVCASIFYASFSFIGIEAVAATAMEADFRSNSLIARRATGQLPHRNANPSRPNLKNPFWKPAMLVPVISSLAYICAGWIVTENVAWDDDRLPSLAWNSRPKNWKACSSIFVNSARDKSPAYGKAVTALLIVNVASTSSTALYIASRSLFGMALRFSGHLENRAERHDVTQIERVFKVVAWTNRFKIPWVSVLASAWWPCVIPFLKYTSPTVFVLALDLVVEMGSVSCILVWGCLCSAAWRLFWCYKNNKSVGTESMKEFLRVDEDLWFHLQRTLAITAAVICFLVVVLGGTMTYLHNNSPLQAVAAFSIFTFFIFGTLALKIWRGRPISWRLTNLCDSKNLREIFARLEEQRKANWNHLEPTPLTKYDLFGIVDSEVIGEKIAQFRKRAAQW